MPRVGLCPGFYGRSTEREMYGECYWTDLPIFFTPATYEHRDLWYNLQNVAT